MSSTRLKNAPCEYKQEQRSIKEAKDYVNYYNKLHHSNTRFPTFGINMGNMPADVLSSNYADVDSFLKGTYFNNLENPKKDISVEINTMKCATFFERPEILMPEKLTVDKNRPVIFRR